VWGVQIGSKHQRRAQLSVRTWLAAALITVVAATVSSYCLMCAWSATPCCGAGLPFVVFGVLAMHSLTGGHHAVHLTPAEQNPMHALPEGPS